MALPDRYLDESGVLRNLLGLGDRAALAEAETDLVEARFLTWSGPQERTFDQAHLCAIHRHLFQDVYEWAGEYRTVGISKGGPDGFWPWELLVARTDKVLGALRAGPLLRGPLGDEIFAQQIADLYRDLNHLHPFREGNGRTQRIFLNDVAGASDRVIEWQRVRRDENDSACAHSLSTQSSSRLRSLLEPVITTEADREARLALAAKDLERSRPTTS
ncbi:Fic/DOC family protein [Nocardioides ferulae]|uniref:Fic/DOC family protein n=1 Tax=Nocardioides ferulae TaxID=2340821 RepID=UPI000EB3DEBD|nr:Fic family protein [Nocardioides ferulae]